MAVNKNFVVKHGLEVKTDLIYADAQLSRVGIGTTLAFHKLHVNGSTKLDGTLQVVGVTSLGTNTKIINGTLEAGNTGVGTYAQFLISTGAGIAWTTAPTLRKQQLFTALEGQKQFNFAHTLGFLDVFLNGVKLTTTEYTETSAFVTLLNGATAGDTVELIGYYLYDNIGAANTTGIQGITVLEENTITGSPSNVTSINFVGAHVTAAGTGAGVTVSFLGAGVGIGSSGTQIGYGFTNLNFIGVGNTFKVNGQSIDISINSGAENFWMKNLDHSSGIVTTSRVGIGSTLPITAEGLDTRGVVKTDSLFATKKTLDKNVETFAGYNMFAAGSLAIGAGKSITVVDDATLTILDVIQTPVNATLGIFRNGTNIGYGITRVNFTGSNNFVTSASATGVDIKIDSGVGIYSGGQPVAFGITAFNFVGAANTFGVDGGQINISINSGSGGKFADNPTGIHTISRVGIGSTLPNTGAALDVNGVIKTHTFFANKAVVDQDVTTIAGYNMFGAGPITVATGKIISVIDDSTLSVLDAYAIPGGSRWASNSTGIHTSRNVGVGTSTVNGAADPNNTFVLNAGIVTANYYYGDGSFLRNTSIFASNSTGIHTSRNVGIGTSTVNGAADPNNTFVLNAGIVTANYYYGDGRFLRNVGVAVSTAAPSSPANGNMWWNEVLGRGFIYYGAANAWVDFSPSGGGGGGTISVTSIGGTGDGFFSNKQTNTGIHTTSLYVGIGTTNPRFQLEVGPVGAAGTSLWVNGNARVTGILTVGSSSIILDGVSDEIRLGSGVVIRSSGLSSVTTLNVSGITTLGIVTAGNIYSTGIITASSFSGNATSATTATYAVTAGIATYASTTGVATVAQGLTGTPDITVGKITAGVTSSIIPFLWSTYASLPSYSTYHGAVAHAHNTGKLYYAHTRWVEIVNTEADGTVGTGTENYNVGVITATSFVGNLTGTATTAATVNITNTNGLTTVYYPTFVENRTDGQIVRADVDLTYRTDTNLLTVPKLSSAQIIVSGIITASSFSGSGIGLTGIPAGQLTGALPALDGSLLTGVVAAGSGVIITDDDTLVGTAGTINFGANLSVSPVSAGVVTVTASSSGSSQFTTTNAGIHTLSSVGIGTTNPTSALTVVGSGTSTSQLFVTGVSTFAGITTVTGTTLFVNQLGVSGISTLSSAIVGSAVTITSAGIVAGLSTVNYINATHVNTSGVTTTTTLNVGTGGTTIITTSSGSVGVGTTNPVTKLQIDRFGVQTGFGTFAATAGVTTFIDSFTISSTDFKTAEYTVHLQSASSIQTQKVLVMQNESTAYSQEWAVMSHPDLLVSIGATVTSGSVRLNVTPETGVTGIITYRFTRNTML